MAISDPHLCHLFDGTDLNIYSTEVTNLSAGAPGPDLLKLCVDLFQEATCHRLEKEKEKAHLFQYGIASGLWEFRDELGKFLTKNYKDTVHRELLIQTCGATHGLQLAMANFLWPDAVIFVEDATYMIGLQAFKKYPFMRVVSVPMTNEGIDVIALENIAKEEHFKQKRKLSDERRFWAMLYTIPAFHNPTGVSMSERTSQKVVEIARQLDILVVCDDVYNLLNYDDQPPPKRLFAYDYETPGYMGGHVISNGTFSKTLSPGVRVGWLELPPQLATLLRESAFLTSGGATNHYTSGIVTSLLELGLQEKHLKYVREILKTRMTSLCDTFDQKLPEGCSFSRPKGGYFIWIRLPEYINATNFIKWSIVNYKITTIVGSRFSTDNKYTNYLRVSIAFHNKDILIKAGETLCVALKDYIENVVST